MKKVLYALAIIFVAIALFPISGQKIAFADAEDYKGEKIAEFTTDYSKSSAARKHNVELAASLLNGYSVRAGETFSFNVAVGPRTAERGFGEAPVIENGRYVSGVGGGVCQVSSTLYNAAIRAGMSVTEVAHHTLPVHYLPGSLDAMVSDNSDFRFVNVTPYPLYIYSHADGVKITFRLYGFPIFTDGERIKIRSVTVKTIECNEYERIEATDGELKEGESEKYISHPHAGLISEAYCDYYYRDKLVRSERIRRDYYAPRKGVILVKQGIGANIPQP